MTTRGSRTGATSWAASVSVSARLTWPKYPGPAGPKRQPRTRARLSPGGVRPRKLRLRHLRAALDVPAARLLVQLVPRAPARASPMAADSAAATRRDVGLGQLRRLTRLAAPGALLVHGAGGDLLGAFLRRAAIEERVLDVLVLACALRSLLDSAWRHLRLLPARLLLTRGRYPPHGHKRFNPARGWNPFTTQATGNGGGTCTSVEAFSHSS